MKDLSFKNEHRIEQINYNICLEDVYNIDELYKKTGDAKYKDRGWTMVYSYNEFIELFTNKYLKNELPEAISFGVDLCTEHDRIHNKFFGNEKCVELYKNCKIKTGIDAFRWIIKFYEQQDISLPEILFHSTNAYAIAIMKKELKNYNDKRNIFPYGA